MEIKQGVAIRVPVRMRDASGVAITGLAFGAVTVYLQKQAGAATVKVLGAGDWFEIDAVNFPGVYDLLLSATDTNTLDFLKYSVAAAGAEFYFGLLYVVANIESDTFNRIGAPVGVSISADIALVQSTVDGIEAVIGTPATGTVSGDIANVDADVGAVDTKLGTPATGTVSGDIADVQTTVDAILAVETGAWLGDYSLTWTLLSSTCPGAPTGLPTALRITAGQCGCTPPRLVAFWWPGPGLPATNIGFTAELPGLDQGDTLILTVPWPVLTEATLLRTSPTTFSGTVTLVRGNCSFTYQLDGVLIP